jgi:dihydrofolate synthase/folylpolyglutamate synthase
MRERIRLDGVPISEEEVVALVRRLRPHAEALRHQEGLNPPTFFEIYTAMAFLFFAEAGVDLALVETGLGGRLDATNVVEPLVTVITTLGYDHTEILGDTLAEIAREKAGILKPGVPAVWAAQEPEAAAVLQEHAQRLGVPVLTPPVVRLEGLDGPLTPPAPGEELPPWGQHVIVEPAGEPFALRLPLLGPHQRENLGLAWAALQALPPPFTVTPAQFAAGAESLSWPGRFEIVDTSPWLVLDCAHNVPSMRALARMLPQALRYERLLLVLGMSADKQITATVGEIAPQADEVWLTEAFRLRALPVAQLAEQTGPLWAEEPHQVESVAQALAQARAQAGPGDCVLVTGSVFVVGEALQALGLPVR